LSFTKAFHKSVFPAVKKIYYSMPAQRLYYGFIILAITYGHLPAIPGGYFLKVLYSFSTKNAGQASVHAKNSGIKSDVLSDLWYLKVGK